MDQYLPEMQEPDIELQSTVAAAPIGQQGAGPSHIEQNNEGATPRTVKFLQPDGSIWEYKDNFVGLPQWQIGTENGMEDYNDIRTHIEENNETAVDEMDEMEDNEEEQLIPETQ